MEMGRRWYKGPFLSAHTYINTCTHTHTLVNTCTHLSSFTMTCSSCSITCLSLFSRGVYRSADKMCII